MSGSTLGSRVGGISPRLWAVVAAVAVFLVAAAGSQASHLFSDTAGHTTLDVAVAGGDPANGYANLGSQAVSRSYVVRDGSSEANPAIPDARPGRDGRRESLTYFGQLTDFQLADEESPARVEFLDFDPSGTAASAWRPQEALQPFIIDWSIRQMNLFAPASPVPQGDGSRAPMDFALMTGDQADSMQRNEMLWTRDLLEGNGVNPNSGSTDPNDYDPLAHPSCASYSPSREHRDEALRYTGVQDYDDYDEGANPYFYDPDDVRAFWATNGWPTYTGLMDRAQLPFQPAGLAVPSYVTNGNHDGLVQGNEDANAAFEDIATGCEKTLGSSQPANGLDPSVLLAPATASMSIPPDPLRRFVDKRQTKQIYADNGVDSAHGYGFVDPAEDAAANESATYYAWDPQQAPGFRFISIDTLSEGGIVEQSSSGNIDDPQFQWLERELDAASAQDKLIVIFGHHPVRSLSSRASDEAAPPCVPPNHSHGDTPEHNQNPGCDLDPRPSEPIHMGQASQRRPGDTTETFEDLVDRYPHVLAYVAGHTHENRISPFTRPGGGVWWGIETAATADWPVQHRVLEVMDNKDGTLSIFGTVLDHAAAAAAPPPGPAMAFDEAQLASIGRELAYNDPQAGLGSGDGTAADQNVELLVRDPRPAYDHPADANTLYFEFVPEFRQTISGAQCTARGGTNSTHGPPLSFPSCYPPAYVPGTQAHVGPLSTSLGELTVVPGDTDPGNGDQADVAVRAVVQDVQNAAGSDYEPNGAPNDLTLVQRWRLTDSRNGPSEDEPGTTVDFEFPVPFACTPTGDASRGSQCAFASSIDGVQPGAIAEQKQTVIQTFRMRVNDAGPNGAANDGDDRRLVSQGIYIP